MEWEEVHNDEAREAFYRSFEGTKFQRDGHIYSINSLLGLGGQAAVFKGLRATSDGTFSECAIKLHDPAASGEHQLFQLKEAFLSSMSHMAHENIIKCYAAGEVELVSRHSVKQRFVFIVMELAKGGTLSEKHLAARAQNRFIPFEEIKEIIKDVAQGLNHILIRGYTHRDISLENILSDGNRWMVSDLGLVRERKLSSATYMVGKLGYIDPKDRLNVTGQADIFALGQVISILTTGNFANADNGHIFVQSEAGDWIPVQELSSAPYWVIGCLEACLGSDRSNHLGRVFELLGLNPAWAADDVRRALEGLYKQIAQAVDLPSYKNRVLSSMIQSWGRQLDKALRRNTYDVILLESFLNRAIALFGVADEAYVVSRHAVSKFWHDEANASLVQKYLESQPKDKTCRLFVFEEAEELESDIGNICRHYAMYGSGTGGVFICSEKTFDELLPRLMVDEDAVNHMRLRDFGILRCWERDDIHSVEAVLGANAFSFKQVHTGPAAVQTEETFTNEAEVRNLFNTLMQTKPGSLSTKYKIMRWCWDDVHPDILRKASSIF